MSQDPDEIIQIWRYDQLPESLKSLFREHSGWIVRIPPNLVWHESEELFCRLQSDRHRIIRRTLADGSVLFSGGLGDES